MNSDKTEMLVFSPKKLREKMCTHSHSNSNFDGCSKYGDNRHIKKISRASFFPLPNINQFLSVGDAEKLIQAFVMSRLDYCNARLSGHSDSPLKDLQFGQNSAARILT